MTFWDSHRDARTASYWPTRSGWSKQYRCLPKYIKIVRVVLGLKVDKLLVTHCRHPATFFSVVPYLHPSDNCHIKWRHMNPGNWSVWYCSRGDGGNHQHDMKDITITQSAIIMVDIVGCILDKLCRLIRDVQYYEISATFSCLSSARSSHAKLVNYAWCFTCIR